MKAYITKYALTTGIKEVEVLELSGGVIKAGWGIGSAYYHKPDWYITLDLAKEKAEQMRVDKIASLKKQLAKLEKLTF